MLKKRDFLVIASLCLILFIFFLAFSPAMYTGDFRADEKRAIKRNERADSGPAEVAGQDGSQYSVAVVGGTEKVAGIAANTLKWMQVPHGVYEKITDVRGEKMAVITAASFSENDVEDIKAYLSQGGNVIFTALPAEMSDELRELLGIRRYIPGFAAIGFTVYDGMFINGLQHNSDYAFVSMGVDLYARTKVFANGYAETVKEEIKEGPIKAERADKNPLIWRTVYEGGEIYAVNAPFMAESSGAGVLAGILALHYQDFIYPVIGTKTVALKNFPYIADIYYPASVRTAFGYTRDTIWPSLLSTAKNLELLYSCYTAGHFRESWEAETTVAFILEELYRLNRGELAYQYTDAELLRQDLDFMAEKFPEAKIYGLLAMPPQIWDSITSVNVDDGDSGFEWLNDMAVTLPVTGRGIDAEESAFAFESFITAFGFAMHEVDLEPVYLFEDGAAQYMRDVSDKLSELFSGRGYLKEYSARGAAEQVKRYLNLETAASYGADGISVALAGNDGAAKLILRTEKDIDMRKSAGFKLEKIGEGVYLLVAEGDEMTVVFKPE